MMTHRFKIPLVCIAFLLSFVFDSTSVLSQDSTLSSIGYKTPYRIAKPSIETAFHSSSPLQAKHDALLRAAGTGFGLIMAASESSVAYQEWKDYLAGNATWSDAGFHTLMASSGASFAVGGVSSTIATQTGASSRLAIAMGRVGRYAGPARYVLMGGAIGMHGYQYYSGEINTRQFVSATSITGGALAGGLGGALGGGWLGVKIGGAIGTLVGPEGMPVGAGIGGFLGMDAERGR